MRTWPVNFQEQLSGVGCPICAEGRPEEIDGRIRFFSSEWSDGYLHVRGVQRGYAAVIWRGRHVAEPTELLDMEASAFWSMSTEKTALGVYFSAARTETRPRRR